MVIPLLNLDLYPIIVIIWVREFSPIQYNNGDSVSPSYLQHSMATGANCLELSSRILLSSSGRSCVSCWLCIPPDIYISMFVALNYKLPYNQSRLCRISLSKSWVLVTALFMSNRCLSLLCYSQCPVELGSYTGPYGSCPGAIAISDGCYVSSFSPICYLVLFSFCCWLCYYCTFSLQLGVRFDGYLGNRVFVFLISAFLMYLLRLLESGT